MRLTASRICSASTPKCSAASVTLTRSWSMRYGTRASRNASLSRAWNGCGFGLAMCGSHPSQAFDDGVAQGGRREHQHLGTERAELVGEDVDVDEVQHDAIPGHLGAVPARQPGGGI